MTTQSFIDFSGGYTRESAQFSEKVCQFVKGSKNIDVFAKQDDGFGFKTMAGNQEHSTIAGKSIYNLFEYIGSTDKYLLAHTADTVQLFNEATSTYSVLKSGLTATAKSASFDTLELTTVGVGTRHLGFFTNGVDSSFIYEKGQTPEVQDVTTVGVDGKTIVGTIAVAYDGRIWLVDGANLYRSKQLDPFNFSTAEDAGVTQYGSTIIAVKRALGGLLISTLNGLEFIKAAGDGTYFFQTLSANTTVNKNCLSVFGKSALMYTNNGVYPIDPTQIGVNQIGNNISYSIDAELSEYGQDDRDNAQLLEVTNGGRNETWLHIPGASSTIYILRWKKGNQKYPYWLPPRVQQKINCLIAFKDKIISGTDDGKVLEEMSGTDYDGAYYESVAVTPKINFGNYSGKLKVKPVLFLDNETDNNFYLEYVVSGDTTQTIEQYIEANNSQFGVFAESEEDLNGIIFATNEADATGGSFAVNALSRVNLDKAKSKSKTAECSLQFIFKTKEQDNFFAVHCLDLTRIKKKSK